MKKKRNKIQTSTGIRADRQTDAPTLPEDCEGSRMYFHKCMKCNIYDLAHVVTLDFLFFLHKIKAPNDLD